jgi:hypothetical protein
MRQTGNDDARQTDHAPSWRMRLQPSIESTVTVIWTTKLSLTSNPNRLCPIDSEVLN